MPFNPYTDIFAKKPENNREFRLSLPIFSTAGIGCKLARKPCELFGLLYGSFLFCTAQHLPFLMDTRKTKRSDKKKGDEKVPDCQQGSHKRQKKAKQLQDNESKENMMNHNGHELRSAPLIAAELKRKESALSTGRDRLHLIDRDDEDEGQAEYVVKGSTGNVYYVQLNTQPKCSCRDQRVRKLKCKHMLFVFLRVLGLKEADHPYLLRHEPNAKMSQQELNNIKKIIKQSRHKHLQGDVLASSKDQALYAERSGNVLHLHNGKLEVQDQPLRGLDNDCPICFEPYHKSEE
eukprot:g532.t1